MLVHFMGAGQHRFEVVHADGERDRQADRGPQAVAPADPVPEDEHVFRIDAELGDLRLVGRNRDEVLGDRLFVAGRPSGTRSARYGRWPGFPGGKVLDATMKRVVAGSHFFSVSAMWVPSTLDTKCMRRSGCLELQRLARHVGAEVGASDPDIHHVGDLPAVMPGPGAVADGLGEPAHLRQHRR